MSASWCAQLVAWRGALGDRRDSGDAGGVAHTQAEAVQCHWHRATHGPGNFEQKAVARGQPHTGAPGGLLAATWTMPLASGMRGPTVVTAKGASSPGARLISQPGASHGATDSDVTVMVQVSGVCNVNSEPRMLLGPISGSVRWVVCQPEGHGSSRPDRY